MSIARRTNLISASSTKSARAIFQAKRLHAYSSMFRHGRARSMSKLIASRRSKRGSGAKADIVGYQRESALPPKADIAEGDRHVSFVPKADIALPEDV